MSKKPFEQFDPTDMTHPLYDPARDPSHPFYEKDKTDGQQRSDPPGDNAYKVGPGRPPREHMWKKGCPSPWPKGRPKKVPPLNPDLKKALEAALNEKVKVKKGEREVTLAKATLGIQQLVNQFAKGDRYARRDLFHYSPVLGVDFQAEKLIAEALGANDQAIVDAFLQRQRPSAPAPADTHVKAPPDLLDDDAGKAEAVATSAAPPQPNKPATAAPEPPLDENGKPLPVSDIRYIRAMRERHLAREKKNQEGG
jgi:Family of unknown function (DUF5681)